MKNYESFELANDSQMKKQELKELLRRYLSILAQKEVMAYIIVGTMTTGVNLAAYYILCDLWGIGNLVANALAWVAAMLFAYYANAKYVFITTKKNFMGEMAKVCKFFSARFVSFLAEEFAMFAFVDVMGINNMLIKAIMNVVVVIINYFFSKQVVFKD
ncbi:MAG TPA: GtrA family protein [Lachnospiraceae bacterium]|nr:GtrA family protein [Lachnospiraceae bacterium]